MFNPGPRRIFRRTCFVLIALLSAAVSPSAHGASHLWVFNEVFSNADGSIQFIELKECCGAANETFLFNKWIKSNATGSMYTFTANLPCRDCTAHQHLLLATQS